MRCLDVIVMTSMFALYAGHVFEILFQGHYHKSGPKFLLGISPDPIILILNALWFRKRLINNKYGWWVFIGLIFEFLYHMTHIITLYRPNAVWYSIFFNTIDLGVLIPSVFVISNLHNKNEIVFSTVAGTIWTLCFYRYTGHY